MKTSISEINKIIDSVLADDENKDDAVISKPKLLISACLLGENCKYNGGNNHIDGIEMLKEEYDLVPVCPECLGGLPTPRPASEISGNRVINTAGDDVTDSFSSGAQQCLYIAEECSCSTAVLKERSPSCGFGRIYSGDFSGTLTHGNGVTAQLLYDNGIRIIGESKFNLLINH